MNTFVCFIYIFAFRLASHSSLGDQNNCCADYENGTNNVEHCCADATGGRKNRTGVIDNSLCLFKISLSIIITSNYELFISSFVVTRRYSFLNKSISTISETGKCLNCTLGIRCVLCCIVNTIYPCYNTICEFVVFVSCIFNYKSCSSKSIVRTILLCYCKLCIIYIYMNIRCFIICIIITISYRSGILCRIYCKRI